MSYDLYMLAPHPGWQLYDPQLGEFTDAGSDAGTFSPCLTMAASD